MKQQQLHHFLTSHRINDNVQGSTRAEPAVLPSDLEEDQTFSPEKRKTALQQFGLLLRITAFSRKANWSVYFMEDFYIGEVTQLLLPEEGTVNLMEKATFGLSDSGQPIFRWPAWRDKCKIIRWRRVCKRHCFAARLIIRPNLHCNCSWVLGWNVLSFEGFFRCIVSLLFFHPSTYFLVTKIK